MGQEMETDEQKAMEKWKRKKGMNSCLMGFDGNSMFSNSLLTVENFFGGLLISG